MVRTASLFSQIVRFVDRVEFMRSARVHDANRFMKPLDAWGQFVAIVIGQMALAKNLREVCDGLGSAVGKAVHLAVVNVAEKSTLSCANKHRPSAFLQALLSRLAGHSHRPGMAGRRRFRTHHRLLTLDSKVIMLCLSRFPWGATAREPNTG